MPVKKSTRRPNNGPDAAKPRPAKTGRPTVPTAGDDSATESGSSRVRLQRALASAGFGSRRQCEELILEGRVEVDGSIADQLGCTIDPSTSKVFVDGTPLKSRRLVYYIVNKPPGVVTTNADPEGRPRVIDLVPPDERVFPVGRLDRSSEGLILLTNDGELAQRLAHPKYEVQKVYRVTVAGNVQAETVRQMHQGIYIAEGLVKVEGARILKARARATEMEITLKEGKNREIRRILARLGHKVQTLKRIAIGLLKLGEMPSGAYRRLTVEEIRKLKTSLQGTPGATDESSPQTRKSPRPGKNRPTGKTDDRPRPTSARSESGVKRPQRSPQTKTTSRTKDGSEPLIQVSGMPKRRSGVVIGAESPSDVAAPRFALPIELENELPDQPRRGRRDRSSRFAEVDDDEFEMLVENDGPPRGKRGAKTGGRSGANPRGKKVGKTNSPRSSTGGMKTERAGKPAGEGRPVRSGKPVRSDKPGRDGKPAGEGRPVREGKPVRDGKPVREGRPVRQSKPAGEGRPVREGKPIRDGKPIREGRPVRDGKPAGEGRPVREGKPIREGKPAREGRPVREGKAAGDSKPRARSTTSSPDRPPRPGKKRPPGGRGKKGV